MLRPTSMKPSCPFPYFLRVGLVFAAFVAWALAAEDEPAVRIGELRRELARHDDAYRRADTPEISDADYDRLKRRLVELERRHPAAARTTPALAEFGDDRSGLFRTLRHRERMLSLDKAYTEAELRNFHARLARLAGTESVAYVVEPKYDGLAISLTYENGRFVRATTRGNGAEGDDVTEHLLQLAALPERLVTTASDGRPLPVPEVIEFRGEVYVPFTAFAHVNAAREAAGETGFANPRNLAAGTLRQLDVREVTRRGLRLAVFGVAAAEPRSVLPATQRELQAQIQAWGLPGVAESWPALGVEEMVRAVETCRRVRAGLDFPIDGAVVKADSLVLQRAAGVGESAPRWAVAYKFAAERVETTLLGITLQVGRTGALTPVAELAPVVLAGSMVARATLHNREEIARRDLRIGDSVYLEKAGDVIPAVVGVNLARRPAAAVPFSFPMACPACGEAIVEVPGEPVVRCGNAACPAQVRRRFEHFTSKAAVDIPGLGPATIDGLVAQGRVRDIPDLYRLQREDLLAHFRGREKPADRLLAAINASRTAELWRIVFGLGLPQVGPAGARELARKYGGLAALAGAGAAAHPALAEPRWTALLQELVAAGVGGPSGGPPPAAATGPLQGKVVVLTGTLSTLTRAQATARIEAAGGKVGSSVSRTTDLVVAGTEPGAKLDQARRLGVTVLDEPALWRLLEGR